MVSCLGREMNSRRKIVVAFGAGALSVSLGAFAQQPRKVWRIGYLVMTPFADNPSPERLAFLDGLRALGYIDGENLKIIYRSAQYEPQFLPDLATDLVMAGVDVIFAVESNVVSAAAGVSTTVPIVFVSIIDPVEMKFANSLNRPGKNITGITLLGVNLAAKRLELLRDLLPKARRIAVLRMSALAGNSAEWSIIKPAAAKLGFELVSFQIRDTAEFNRQVALIVRAKPDGLFILTDSLSISARGAVADFALKQNLPSIMGFSGFAEAGELMSLAPNFVEQFRRAATYVDKVLKGARPGEIPIEQPSTLELIVNVKTAKALGIKFPPSILARADRVIE